MLDKPHIKRKLKDIALVALIAKELLSFEPIYQYHYNPFFYNYSMSQISQNNFNGMTRKIVSPVIPDLNVVEDFQNSFYLSPVPEEIKGLENISDEEYVIAIEKINPNLTIYQKKDSLWENISSYVASTGMNPGDKKKNGDHKTPVGDFFIKQIQNSKDWVFEGRKAYGPYFMRLSSKWGSIGIHGTDEPELLGQNVSHGCIRLNDKNVYELMDKYVSIGTKVLVRDSFTFRYNCNNCPDMDIIASYFQDF
jgi:hypothetical protein